MIVPQAGLAEDSAATRGGRIRGIPMQGDGL